MSGAARAIELPRPIHGHQPTTFLERGVVVPYTTPHLAGARVRPGERSGLELIVPNLSGGPGVYVLPLDGVFALCSPTLHDRALNERIASIRAVSPGALRQAAREVAADGLAGEPVAEAAQASIFDDQQQGMLAHLELLMELLRQVEPRPPGWSAPDPRDPEQLGHRARFVMHSLMPQTGRSGEEMMGVLEELATLFRAVGVGRQTPLSRLSGLIGMLDDLRQDLLRWLRNHSGSEAATDAEIVAATAGFTLNAARVTLHDARALLNNLTALLRQWLHEPERTGRLVARPEWLLDGWERICLLWQTAGGGIGQELALAEMMALVPAIPQEASGWVPDFAELAKEVVRTRRKVVLGEDWRTGVTVTDLVARNERMRALSPGGPL